MENGLCLVAGEQTQVQEVPLANEESIGKEDILFNFIP